MNRERVKHNLSCKVNDCDSDSSVKDTAERGRERENVTTSRLNSHWKDFSTSLCRTILHEEVHDDLSCY